MTEFSPTSTEEQNQVDEQQKLAYKLEDILRDKELAYAIGNILTALCLPRLESQGLITSRQHIDLDQIYDRTLRSDLTPEGLEQVEEEEAYVEWEDEQRRRKGLSPKRTYLDL